MEPTDIKALTDRARVATDAIASEQPPGRTSSGRTCAELAGELSRVAAQVPDAVAEAEALIDISNGEFLTDELQDYAALCASALFLGRRLLDTNADEIAKLHPQLAAQLRPVKEVAATLDRISESLLRVFNPPGWLVRSAA